MIVSLEENRRYCSKMYSVNSKCDYYYYYETRHAVVCVCVTYMHNTADHNNIVGIGNSCCRGYRLHLNILGECWHCVYKHDKTTLHKVIIII